MKKILLSSMFHLLLWQVGSYGQASGDNTDISTISIAVVMPASGIKGLDQGQVSILENRIKSVVSMNGLSAEGGLEGFVMYPKFDILGTDKVTSTIKTLTILHCNLSLFVQQFIPNATSNIEFTSFNLDITGSGYTEAEAISNALTQVRPSDNAFQDFLDKTRSRIVNYYKQNCDKIITEATNAANLENYSKSFALLLSIPKEATQCYGQVQQKTIEIYLKKQKQDCKKLILKSKSYIASGDFRNALDTLRKIDPESVCKEEVWTLLNEIETKVDAREKEALELYKEQMRNNTDIEKARYAAISEIGKAYLDGARKVNYTVKGNGPNATIISDQPVFSADDERRSPTLPKKNTSMASTVSLLETTALKPVVMFENNIFPSYILSGGIYDDVEDIKKYGNINSCIGMSVINPTFSGTVNYEIDPVEKKFFDKVTGTISFIQNQQRIFFPEIPWKFDELKGLQQSTQLSIKFRLIDQAGKVKENIIKVNIRSIRECITDFVFDGKNKETLLLAAYVNEENPYIEKLLKEGIDKNWVSSWSGYQEGPALLDKQVQAIWKILSSKGIRYSSITGATTNTTHTFTSQIVRPFCSSIYNKQANCVDGTLVFASILKNINIRPVLVLVPGHCFLAYHKTNSDANEYIFLETTILGDIKGNPTEDAFESNYHEAIKAGTEAFKAANGNFFMIDVQAARLQKVLPINLSDDACK